MRVINIIVHDNDTGIISIDSFGIADEQMSSEVVEQAEQLFKEKCVDLKFGNNNHGRDDLQDRNSYREELDVALDDGWEEIGEHTVSIVWSDIENIQL